MLVSLYWQDASGVTQLKWCNSKSTASLSNKGLSQNLFPHFKCVTPLVPLLLASCQFHYYWHPASSTITGILPVPLYWHPASSTVLQC
ncbi:MAG: hypothetical protein F6K47_39575 [Symploca sp. SIO2E6]|nr:hypothetical protein [Symploca sp. SIO2E6]